MALGKVADVGTVTVRKYDPSRCSLILKTSPILQDMPVSQDMAMAESATKDIGGDDAAPVVARPVVADAPTRPRLTFDLDVDICVIGAGLAGLTLAREAARMGASVAVLEGRHVGWNASGQTSRDGHAGIWFSRR